MKEERSLRLKPSYFDYGGEVDVCVTYRSDDKPCRLSIRRTVDFYELYARSYVPSPFTEVVITRGTLEDVIASANTLMREYVGPDWRNEDLEPEEP